MWLAVSFPGFRTNFHSASVPLSRRFAGQQRVQVLPLRRQFIGIDSVTIDSKRGADIAMPQHGRDRFQINSIRYEPATKAVPYVMEAPTLDQFATRVEVAKADIEQVEVACENVTVADVVRLFNREEDDAGKLRRTLNAPLEGGWKEALEERRRDLRGR